MENIDHITDTLGRTNIADMLGVSRSAVSMALARGSFPASWYVTIKSACDAKNVDCPETAFNFKTPCTLVEGA